MMHKAQEGPMDETRRIHGQGELNRERKARRRVWMVSSCSGCYKLVLLDHGVDRIYSSVFEDDLKRLTINPEFLTESANKEQFVIDRLASEF